uniref:Secreted protein n=1 Tax=Strongyloides venezuelensis TaxID=75913 RepID=A0A0K0FPR3_STRVS
MQRLMNLFSIIVFTSGHLEREIFKINSGCWTTSVEHLQDSDRINNFFGLFPCELLNVRGSTNAFLATIHNYLHLSDDFTFDSNKLQNIVKQRKKRYNTVEIVENSPQNVRY